MPMDITKLLTNKKEIRLPVVAEREVSIIQYRRILMRIIRVIRKAVREEILPDYTRGLTDSAITTDRVNRFAVIRAVAGFAVNTATNEFETFIEGEAESHLMRILRSVKRGTGIDVDPRLGLNQSEVDDLVKLYIERNAALITSLSDDLINKVEGVIYQAKIDRLTRYEVMEILRKTYKLSENRAALIAVDQLGAINYDFTAARHSALKITSYRWRGRADSRMRPSHAKMHYEGAVFKYGERTRSENGLPPGKEIRCRCNAVGIIPPASEANRARNERNRRRLIQSNNEARTAARRNS